MPIFFIADSWSFDPVARQKCQKFPYHTTIEFATERPMVSVLHCMYLASRRCIHVMTFFSSKSYRILIISSYHHHEQWLGESTCFSLSFALLNDYPAHSKLLATQQGQIDILLQTWIVQMSLAQTRAINCDEHVLLSNKRGSKVQTIDKECSKIEVGSRLLSCKA
jgi:hypothetical protein